MPLFGTARGSRALCALGWLSCILPAKKPAVPSRTGIERAGTTGCARAECQPKPGTRSSMSFVSKGAKGASEGGGGVCCHGRAWGRGPTTTWLWFHLWVSAGSMGRAMVQHPASTPRMLLWHPACVGCSKGRKRTAEGEGAQIKGIGKGVGTLLQVLTTPAPLLPLGMEHLWPCTSVRIILDTLPPQLHSTREAEEGEVCPLSLGYSTWI